MVAVIGNSDFTEVIKSPRYIDKTLFIKEFINDDSKVNIITRPRRFGKSLNLSMTENFFDIEKDSTDLFKDTLIYNYQDIINNHMNKYPVIHINFMYFSSSNYNDFIGMFTLENSFLFSNYDFILESDDIELEKKELFNNIINETSDLAVQKTSLKLLTELLYTYYM